MDGNDCDQILPHEDDIDNRLQSSNDLDLNVEQDNHSPKSSDPSTEQSIITLNPKPDVNGVLKIGMEFESDEHTYRFYNKYAKLVGFTVRKDWVNRSKIHGQVASRKFTCSRQGYRRRDKRDVNVKKHRKETRTGCLAHIIVTRQNDGKYRVTHFEENHNHETVSAGNNADKLQELELHGFEDFNEVNEGNNENNLEIHSKLAFQLLGRQFGCPDNLDYLKIDNESCLESGRTRDMKRGEAGRLLYAFQRQHFENPSFFYAVQFDVDDKLSNVFWADDHMMVDYDYFGDVVCLDSTYRTNRDFRPLVLFIGLNHHKQVVIFGAALLYDETVDSLKWLLRTFVEAMSGKRPKAVLTDQDATIIQAIDAVLHEVDHRTCAWQMYQNALKHLVHSMKDSDSFAKDFRGCIFDHEEEEDFVRAWEFLLDKYALRQNEWLRWMFRDKEKWAAAYGKNTFFIDKNGLHLCENLSDNLKKILNPDLDMIQFFKNFESMVNQQRYDELQATYDMGRFSPRLMGKVILLKHVSDVYTPKSFEIFQREYERCLNVVVNKCGDNGSEFKYKANTFGKSREYDVKFDSSDDSVSCSCMKFEYVGFLCCHALKVLDHRNIKVVPPRYILKRWTKDARIESVIRGSDSCPPQEENLQSLIANRYRNLCKNILKLSARASKSDQAFEFASRQLDELMQGVEKILTLKPCEEAQVMTSSSTGANVSENEPPDVFLDRNTIEGQNVDGFLKGTIETGRSVGVGDKEQLNHFNETITDTSVIPISCPPAYMSSPTPSLNPLAQGFFSFDPNQIVQCMYQAPSLAMDQQPHPNMYQPQNFYPNNHDSAGQSHLLQESLIRSPFKESTSSNVQFRQVMDLDVQPPLSSSFSHYDHRFRSSDNQYFGSK